MPLITNQNSLKQNTFWIAQVEALYNATFPDADEREFFLDILQRIDESQTDIRTIIYFESIGKTITSTMIIDVYRNHYFHLIYLMIAPKFRGQGICRRLLTQEVKEIIAIIRPNYEGIFLESNQPLSSVQDSFNPRTRLDIFQKIGIRRIPIHYIQPPLAAGKSSVRHMYLLFLPSNNLEYSLSKNYIVSFLKNFYQGLGAFPQGNSEFCSMISELKSIEGIDGFIPLHKIL